MVTRETSIRRGLASLGIPDSDVHVRRLSRLCDLLENVAVPKGFLGPAEIPWLVSRHVLESAAIRPYVGDKGAVVDVGSGAGLPGLVLACLRDGPVTLVESQRRRVGFLREAAAALEVRVEIEAVRAEDFGRSNAREAFDVATARAVAPPCVVLELLLPLVRLGGKLVVLAGAPSELDLGSGAPVGDVSRETSPGLWVAQQPAPEGSAARRMAQAPSALPMGAREAERIGEGAVSPLAEVASQLGGGEPTWARFEVPGLDESRWVMIVPKVLPTPERFPRRAGVPQRRPLC